ncbi:bifunctional DNA primase/polymerase [Chitinophaga niabensis]|uniref:Bifunctional DNA primase/polymerase, N-terminal n=1 Tax=Chitinophaga niabensis TaxID=536979 RepID=A0A1N6KC69_9BACT|nr:bifunctional DNA primase/polymerase [Chitinophaga niabensis]SIO53926.1 Bifunctional DNA primase/polymerase, N-terminal [Chitinophaga niabensis]
MEFLIKAALDYRSLGLSVIAVNQFKKPIWRWKCYTSRLPTKNEIVAMFKHPDAAGIAIICGEISGNLEAIDMDIKNDLSKTLYTDFVRRLEQKAPGLESILVKVSTRSQGFHWYYRCPSVSFSKILAQRCCTELEKSCSPQEKMKVLVESRGTDGIIIVPPTPDYNFISNDISMLPVIGIEHRKMIFDVSKSFDAVVKEEATQKVFLPGSYSPFSPLDDYDIRGDIIELLVKHGWVVVERKDGKTIFKRPGDSDHPTSGDFDHVLGKFGVFTTSTKFRPTEGYKPSAVYAILECGGNFKLAAKKLLGEGYGVPYKQIY